MAVTAKEMLDAAITLGQGNSEVDWRNAASRAYYAAYHRCRRMAEDERLSIPEGGSAHAALADALVNGINAPIRRIGLVLDLCRARRARADYDIDDSFPRELANTVVEDCERLLAEADSV